MAEEVKWHKEEEAVKEYAYSFALIGDTQNLAMLDGGTQPCGRPNHPTPEAWRGQHYMNTLYSWIVDNKESKKIAHAFILGDITENISVPSEWAVADEAIHLLDGKVEHSIVRGNHDHPKNFVEVFDHAPYKDTIEGCFEKHGIRSCYKRFEVCGEKYLSLILDHGASDEVLEWADGVLASFPEYKVIISTHTYLDGKGNLITHETNAPATPLKNDGVEMWNKVFRKHKNICMTFSGHYGVWAPAISKTVGDNGNSVLNIMIDSEGVDLYSDAPGAMVLMLYFAKDGKSVDVRYYSTARDEFYGEGKTIEL